MLKTMTAKVLNFFVHGFNSISILIDIFVHARPYRIPHLCFSIVFGVAYGIFSVSYWAAGGLGKCNPCDEICVEEENAKDNGGCITNGGCILQDIDGEQNLCYTYIYPITDWGNHPGVAAITVVAGMIILPVIHMIWLGIFKLRMLLFEKTYGKIQVDDEPRPEQHEYPLL